MEQHLGGDIIVSIVFYSPLMVEVYLAMKNINNVTGEGARLVRGALNQAVVIIVNAKVHNLVQAKNPCGAVAL